jgi:hypothetical protein
MRGVSRTEILYTLLVAKASQNRRREGYLRKPRPSCVKTITRGRVKTGEIRADRRMARD